MKKIKIPLVFLAIVLIVAIIFLSILNIRINASTPHLDHFPENNFEETIVVVADNNYPPFSFIDENGDAVGSDIEIIYALANEIGVNVDVSLMEWPDPCTEVEAGTADVVLGMEYVDYYINKYDLTKPVEINQFVAFGLESYDSLQEFYSKDIGILNCSATRNLFTKPMALTEDVTVYESYEDAFTDILNGNLDYFVGRYPLGNRVLVQEGIKSINAVGSVLVSDAFCFGVKQGNTELLSRLNTAIDTLNSKGVLSKISTKWLGNFSELISLRDYISHYSDILIIILSSILIILTLYVVLRWSKWKLKAERDLTTGLYNKKTAEYLGEKSISAKKEGGTVIIVDMDNLKIINDTFGHKTGDLCILAIADVLTKTFRPSDIIGRIGGD